MNWKDYKKKRSIVRSLTDELSHQLKFANDWKIHEDNLNWSIFGFFLAANVLILVYFFDNYNTQSKFGLFCAGFVLSIIWFVIQNRAVNFRIVYDELVFQLEEELKIPEKFQTPQFKENWMKFLPIIAMFGWVVIVFLFR
jgi:hypothetical protein